MSSLSKKAIFLALVTCFSFLSHAGPSSGGGGSAFVCRDQNGNITRSILLDLWEAERVYQWKISRNNDSSSNDQIRNALKKFDKIDPGFSQAVVKQLSDNQNLVTYLSGDVLFNTPDDARAQFSDPNCALSGMLYFDDRLQKLFVSTPIFSKLETQTDVAGAWLHEAIYKLARTRLENERSSGTRALVGCLLSEERSCFANNDLKAIFQGFAKVEYCRSKSIDYYKGSQPYETPARSLVAIKRVGRYDFSGNYLLSAPASSLHLNPSLSDIGLNAWNVSYQDEASGGFWPLPAGLTVSNKLSGEYFNNDDVNCTETML